MSGREGLRLGCKPRTKNAPLLLAKYFLKDIAPAPEKVYREYKIPPDAWGMFGNDTIGDCTCACIAHILMLVTAHTGKLVIPDESDVIAAYSAVSGYDPITGANDNGAEIPDVLNYWMNTGLAGHKILAWADIDYTNEEAQKQGIYIFGATDDAVQLPNSAMDQFQADQAWVVEADDGGIDGGHSIPRFGYGSGGASCVTWAKTQPGSWDWWAKYLLESSVVITQDWINQATGLAPNTLDMDALQADLKALKA